MGLKIAAYDARPMELGDSKETGRSRTIIVHYHIFKNAGTSVDRILWMAFGSRWASLEGPTPTSLLRPNDLSVFVKDQPEILAVSSHLLRPPAPKGLRVLPVVLIRHPLDRAFSVYSHLRRNPGDIQSGAIAKRTSFSEFVDWCLNHKSRGGMVISNYQVIHLSNASFRSGHIYDATATENDLRHAIDYLSDVACLGTVDRFDAAMTRLRQVAQENCLHITAASVAENVTSGRPKELGERLSIARQELGLDLHRRYLQENELDYRLYAWACRYHADASARWRLTARLPAAKHGTRRLRPGRHGTGIPARDQSLLAGRSVRQIWWFALILSSVIAATDAILSHVILIVLLAVGPFCGLLTGRWARTASAGIWAVVLAVLLGLPDEIWDTRTQLVDVSVVATVALLSTFAAVLIESRRYRRMR